MNLCIVPAQKPGPWTGAVSCPLPRSSSYGLTPPSAAVAFCLRSDRCSPCTSTPQSSGTLIASPCASAWWVVGWREASWLCPQNYFCQGLGERQEMLASFFFFKSSKIFLYSFSLIKIEEMLASFLAQRRWIFAWSQGWEHWPPVLAPTFRRVFSSWRWAFVRLSTGHPVLDGVGIALRGWDFLVWATRVLNINPAHILRNEEFLKLYLFPDYPLLRCSPLHAVFCHRWSSLCIWPVLILSCGI